MKRDNGTIQPIFKVDPNASVPSIASMASNQISFELSLGTNVANKMVGLETISIGGFGLGGFGLLRIYGSDGEIRYLNNGSGHTSSVVPSVKVSDSGSITTIRVVMDFDEKTVKFYDGNGVVLRKLAFSAEKATMTGSLLDVRTVSPNWQGSIRIYGIKIAEGNMFE